MEPDIVLQLEALKLIQQWSIWLITLSSAFLGLTSFAFREFQNPKSELAAKLCIGFLFATVVLAVFLVGAIPAIVQKLHTGINDHLVVMGANARGIYGYKYLDLIPVWLLVSGQRITFLVGIFFGARLMWLHGLNRPS